MAQASSRSNLIWIILNDALRRKTKSTDVKQLIDEDRNKGIVSGNNNIVEKFNNYFANIGNIYGENFRYSYAFEEYMSSAIVSQPFKF